MNAIKKVGKSCKKLTTLSLAQCKSVGVKVETFSISTPFKSGWKWGRPLQTFALEMNE